jgi:hypothetical protein
MGVRVKAAGRYQLREDEHRHRFLVLDGKHWYVWISGQQSPILVRSPRAHPASRPVQRGRYYLVDFKDDPEFRDLPHLFLQKGERYQELLLPNGLPTARDPQKRLVLTRKLLPPSKVEGLAGQRATAAAVS